MALLGKYSLVELALSNIQDVLVGGERAERCSVAGEPVAESQRRHITSGVAVEGRDGFV
ncbi:MAG: hypothetical protein ACFB0E_08450 [Leptolyngbyaceae cyanobacterium]